MADNIEMTEDQADELLSQVEAPTDTQTVETPQAQPEEFAFTFEGKEVKGNRDQILKWASQGYNAPNKIGELSQKLKSYAEKEQMFKQYEEKYSPVDKFMKDNPGFWDEVYGSYQNKIKNAQNPQGQSIPELDGIKKELDDIKNFKLQLEQERQNELIKKEDEAYQSELTALSKAYPQIDFQTLGEDGKSLEYKVLEHARDNGIKSFKTAFRDFYHDELMRINSERTKEDLVKNKQLNSKRGLLGESFAPTKNVSSDVKGKSWDDLAKEAIKEYVK